MRLKTFISPCGKYIQDNTYKILSESVRFSIGDATKTFWCFGGFAVPSAVHLQNAKTKFHKVVQRHYSGEVENVYTSACKIYLGQYTPNFIKIGQVLWKK